MAFGFYGTFTLGQWDVFRSFTYAQKVDIQSRILWLQRELFKVGRFETSFNDDGTPDKYSVGPNSSYGAKLVQAYEILGGVLERDMLLRTRDKPVFFKRKAPTTTAGGTETLSHSTEFTDGRVFRGDQRFDRDVGIQIESLKNWQLEAIKAKRERLEYKIKRTLDYSDELERELKTLQSLIADDGLDDKIREIDIFITDPKRLNFTASSDKFGLKIGPPADFSSVNAGENALAGHERKPLGK